MAPRALRSCAELPSISGTSYRRGPSEICHGRQGRESAVSGNWTRVIAVVIGLTGMFTFAGGAHGAASGNDATLASASVAYLQARAADWGIRRADQEFRLRRVVGDALGQTHVRLDQVRQGVPVVGRQLVVHFDRGGSPRSITGAYLAGITAAPPPPLPAPHAQHAPPRPL